MGDGESRRRAVALGYERGKDRAPRVLAKGSGIVAERILELAKAHGVPLREDPALISLLATVDVDSEIPPALYHAVAEVLAFVYRLREARS